ncbi:MAG: TolC family protein [Cyclobacteriaceae bacterium]|nr:TolC family protein [Cyclobacteriaceae bacterium]
MNKKRITFIFSLLITSFGLYAQNQLSLEDIIARSKGQSPASKQAETRKENRYWQYRFYKTNYNPQLRLEGSLPSYYKRVNQIPQNDGTFKYIPVEQTNNNINLGLQQPIPWTGGLISANTGLGYFRDFNDPTALAKQWSGTIMGIRLDQPLFAYNDLRWDKKTEPLRYEESKREYVEQMEFISREAVTRFFNVLQAQINIQIAQFNLANNDTIYKIEQGRYNIGTTSQDKLLQVELQLLRSRQDVAQANLDLETARLQLRTFIGLKDGDEFQLVLPVYIPQFDVTVDEALALAKQNRAAFIAFERRRIEAAREVAEARGQRFQTNLSAAYGLNNNGLAFSDVYVDPEELQQFNLTLSIPVLDWGRNKSRMQTAIANKKLNDYVIAQDEVTFEQEIMTQVRRFEMLRLQIEITKKSDEVASERYNVAQNRYLIGKIDITNLNIALNEKDDAKRSYIQALNSFWTAYYDLRRLTLYDFSTKQLLYHPEH